MQPPTSNPITQGKHGKYNAVDYDNQPDPYVYAPEDGTVSFYANAGNCGNNLQLTTVKYIHGFCHLERAYVKVGDRVKKGQKIAKMGYTGYTEPDNVPEGAHLHWVLRVGNTYYYPPSKVTEEFGENVNNTKKVSHVRANQIKKAVLYKGMSKSEYDKYYKNMTELQLFERFRTSKRHGEIQAILDSSNVNKLQELKDKIVSFVKGA